MKKYHFLWRRRDLSAWHPCVVTADDVEGAIEAMRKRLAKRSDFPHNVVVDHPFYEKEGTVIVKSHTLTKHSNPFPVMFANVVEPIQKYPAVN